MQYDEMYNALNKGIPNYTNISLDTSVLIRECANDTGLLLTEIVKVRNKYESILNDIFGFAKAQFYFFNNFRIFTSYKNSETMMSVDPTSFIIRLKDILGVSNDSLDFNDEELKQAMLKRLEVLKSVKSPDELKDNFPLIYDDYELSFRAYNKVKSSSGTNDYERLRFYYKLYGLDTRFNVFLNHQIDMYRNFIIRRQFVDGYCNRNPLNLNDFKSLDKDKFELYVAYQYLNKANNCDDFYVVQDCIKYLAAYIREFQISNLENISINIDNNMINFKTIFNGYTKLFRMYPDLLPLDSKREFFKGYHGKHVENHVKKYYSKAINWYLVPNGKLDELNNFERENVVKTLNKQYNYLSKDERDKIIKKRYEVYDRKVSFYDNSGYIFKLMGLNEFNGYIAYIYNNGCVILDKLFYDYTTGRPAYDEAAYIMSIEEFDKLSKFNKTELKDMKGVCRKYHSGKWEERLKSAIDKEGTSEDLVNLNEFKLKHKI